MLKQITRRKVQIVLGVLWLLDGALQLQHQMFSSAFATQVISPAAEGQPRVVSGVMHLAITIFLYHPAVFNSFAATTQLGLGVLILWKRTVKWGLIFSIIWALFVWYVGEGAGGVLSGQTLILMGAPGAALLYAIIALGVMPIKVNKKNKEEAKHPAYWLALVWAALWVGGAIYQLLPGQNTVSDVSGMISGMADGAPGWMASLDNHTANWVAGFGSTSSSSMAGMHMTATQMAQMHSGSGSSGYWFILLLALIQLAIGLGVFLPNIGRKIAIGIGIVVLLAFWVIGQSLGTYFTGLATDPNAAPLYILLAICILGCSQLDQHLSRLAKRIEQAAT